MEAYRHYSIDLWGTVIKSNPNFKPERAKYFCKNLNKKNKSLEEIEAIFRSVDIMCNSINETTGLNIDAQEMYLMVAFQINECLTMDDDLLSKIDLAMSNLIVTFPPLILNQHVIPTLEILKKHQKTMNISSNTAFIKGKILRQVLIELKLDQYFNFQIYSDEIGYSKPSPYFYDIVLSKTKLIHHDIQVSEILHVGDNPIADLSGAKNAGFQSMLIDNQETNFSHLMARL
jgi:putative hydrolase of the HAD superfamily